MLLRLQIGLEDRLKHHHRRRLNNPVAYRRHSPIELHFGSVSLWVRLK
jgi:hypothetical protein